MVKFLTENIFVGVGGKIFLQSVGIPMSTSCIPFLENLFLYSY
jgi:hypothetical protein